MESPLRFLPLECTQAHSHHEQNKIQTVTVNLTQCDCLYPCPFHIIFFIPCAGRSYRCTKKCTCTVCVRYSTCDIYIRCRSKLFPVYSHCVCCSNMFRIHKHSFRTENISRDDWVLHFCIWNEMITFGSFHWTTTIEDKYYTISNHMSHNRMNIVHVHISSHWVKWGFRII